jgi:hypothetical protein
VADGDGESVGDGVTVGVGAGTGALGASDAVAAVWRVLVVAGAEEAPSVAVVSPATPTPATRAAATA